MVTQTAQQYTRFRVSSQELPKMYQFLYIFFLQMRVGATLRLYICIREVFAPTPSRGMLSWLT